MESTIVQLLGAVDLRCKTELYFVSDEQKVNFLEVHIVVQGRLETILG